MENLSFRIDKKITPVRIGENKYRFAIIELVLQTLTLHKTRLKM